MKTFKDLIVWQKAMDLVELIYDLTEKFPHSEQFGLTAQMRRSVVSIPSNIAEGRKHSSKQEFRRCVRIAFGSGSELETQVLIVKRLSFGRGLNFSKVDALLEEVMKMLNSLITNLSSNS
ncbi:four helix bundle protein [Candidatus Peribacteria bacterium]|nr:four helix bundle protein [Candidatus Peribacteria bacterium]